MAYYLCNYISYIASYHRDCTHLAVRHTRSRFFVHSFSSHIVTRRYLSIALKLNNYAARVYQEIVDVPPPGRCNRAGMMMAAL